MSVASNAKTKATAAATRAKEVIAASMQFISRAGGLGLPVWLQPSNAQGPTLIDNQKGRNNYYKLDGRRQAFLCRRVAEVNWFFRGVLPIRHAVTIAGFKAINAKDKTPITDYDFQALVSDIVSEHLISSNVVCLWRKGEKLPYVSVLDMDRVEYSAPGGIERIVIQYTADQVMARDQENKDEYIKVLGERMYKAQTTGGKITIIKWENEEEWDFEVMTDGKRRGAFSTPEMVSILSTIDFMELMDIGDWNLAFARKDVMRWIKKGYKVAHGSGAGVNSVDITKPEIDEIGTAFSKLNGNCNVPMNHDVEVGYLTMSSEVFNPDQVKSAVNKLLFYGGIEAVVLLGSFSQQNGASPSLMWRSRVLAESRREKVESLLRRIFAAPEFSGIDWGVEEGQDIQFKWSVKPLYSLEELMKVVKETNDGTLSPQTRRSYLDVDNDEECRLMKEAHADRESYMPPFEAGQALLAAYFPDEFEQGNASSSSSGSPGSPGRPSNPPAV
jgi:hypothetical protein